MTRPMARSMPMLLLAILWLMQSGATAGADDIPPLTLVENGRSQVAVIAQKGPEETKAPNYYTQTPFEKYDRTILTPARDIATYLGKMSGAEVPFLFEGDPVPETARIRIYVGDTEAARKAGIAFPSGADFTPREDAWMEEGYVVQTRGNDIFIGGNQDGYYIGPAFGCYAFLKVLGCRWYFPGEWGESIPRQTTIVVPHLNLRSNPDFAIRNIGYSGWVPVSREERAEFARYVIRNGMNPGHKDHRQARFYPSATDGSLMSLLPVKEFGTTHPEFFPMLPDGTRNVSNPATYCFSNPDLVEAAIANLKLAFAGEKSLGNVTPTGVGLSPKDGAPLCYCEDCKKLNDNFVYPAYVHLPQTGELQYALVAKLARAFPDKYVATAAYSLREIPPQKTELPDNVVVQYAPIACDVLHPNNHPKSWQRQEFWSMLEQYRRQTPHVYIADYNPGMLLGYFVPERMAENAAVNIPMYRKLGIKGNLIEGRKAVMQTWLSYYITGALLWDAEADVEQLKREFYADFFGPAAAPVRAWWDTIADTLVDADIQAHEDWLLCHIYTVNYVRELNRFVE